MDPDQETQARQGRGVGHAALLGVRFGVPLAMIIGGIAWGLVQGGAVGTGAAIVLVGGGVLVWLSNLIFRMGLESNRDRRREEQARRASWPGARG